MSGVTKLARIANEITGGTTNLGEISKKVEESRLKWHGHELGRDEEYVGKRVIAMEVPGKRSRGRPKLRRLGNIRNDLLERELSEEEVQDWVKKHRHHTEVEKDAEEEESHQLKLGYDVVSSMYHL